MSEKSQKKIVIIGCGSVAWHLANKFKHHALYVYNHKQNENLDVFKTELKAQTLHHLKSVVTDADYYFICVKDEAITSVLKSLNYLPVASLFCITSGNYNLKEYKGPLKSISIFYPIQTFSMEDDVKWKDLCIVTDALQKATLLRVTAFAHELTKEVIVMNYEQRLKLHLAAVFANNFTNSLYVEADKLLKSIGDNFSIKLLYPLVKQSIKKLKYMDPLQAQTGPAKRNDKNVLQKHEELLGKNLQLKELYKNLSSLIAAQQKSLK
jgi:predicted short-subunit dehydrogenase-like oxidoreductase (DUF2520 family)